MTIELLANPSQTYNTRGASYVASALGIISVTNPTFYDIQDLLNSGCVFNTATSGVLLGRLLGANMNVTTDQQINMRSISTLVPFRVTKITCGNGSTSLTTAAGGVYPAASKGGTAVVANTQVYTVVTGATLVVSLTIATTPGNTIFPPNSPLFLSLTTAQGAPATADIYVWGDLFD